MPRFSGSFFPVLLVILAVIAAGARWIIGQIQHGNYIAGPVAFVVFLGLVYLVPMVALLVSRRQNQIEPEAAPQGLPIHAVFVRASLSSRGSGFGWLWFDGEWMRFESDRFEFRLRRSDFRPKDLFRAFRAATAQVVTPKGISQNSLTLIPCARRDDQWMAIPGAWKRLEGPFRQWESAAASRTPSLYPPLRASRAPVPVRFLVRFGLIFAGSLWAAVLMLALILPEYFLTWRLPAVLGGCLLLAPLFSLSFLGHAAEARAINRQIDRAIERGRAG